MINRMALALVAIALASGMQSASGEVRSEDPYERAVSQWEARAMFGAKILNGRQASIQTHPWQAAILVASIPNNMYAHFCGGALIGDQWVITAAHCVAPREKRPAEMQVLLGTDRLNFGGIRFDVLEVRVAPSYDPGTLDHDVALIKLASPVSHTTVPLPTAVDEKKVLASAAQISVSGWGNLYDWGIKSVRLMEVDVPLVAPGTCTAPGAYDSKKIKESMFCAGYADGSLDACNGDSGGPVIAAIAGNPTLLGIISWGTDCGVAKKYGVYARLPLEWIDKARELQPN